jgi:hypothetical protein
MATAISAKGEASSSYRVCRELNYQIHIVVARGLVALDLAAGFTAVYDLEFTLVRLNTHRAQYPAAIVRAVARKVVYMQ